MGLPALHRRKPAPPLPPPPPSPLSASLRALELAFQEAEQRAAEPYRRGLLPARPTLIEHGPLRLLVSAAPSPHALDAYADTLSFHNVKHVVRVCEPTYNPDHLRALGFAVHELPFADGEPPPPCVVAAWLEILYRVFDMTARPDASLDSSDSASDDDNISSCTPRETVAVHCIAGLGRAPVLAAIALVELGLHPYEAVGWIRALRRGAVNARQMAFVEEYARRPPPPPLVVPRRSAFVGGLWPTLKAARPFRPRSPRHEPGVPAVPPPQRQRLPTVVAARGLRF